MRKIKSIEMKMWLSFTAIITMIVLLISFVYFHGFSSMNMTYQKNDLKTMHKIILNGEFQDKYDFGELHNLKNSKHFIIQNNDIISLFSTHIQPNPKSRTLDLEQEPAPAMIEPSENAIIKDYILSNTKVIDETTLIEEKIGNIEFLLCVTPIENGFFVSYLPIFNDTKILSFIYLLGFIFILGGLLSVKIVSGSITKPLKELETLSEKIAKKDFTSTIKIETDDEIGSLAKSMLDMQESLKKVDQEEKQFLQSISHDLKTPVAVILAHAQSIIDGLYIDTPEVTAEIIKNEAIRLDKKIKTLLYFNTLDFSLENQEEIETINAKELLFNLMSKFKFSNPDLTWEEELNDFEIDVDYEKMSIAIENIIDNALRYAKSTIKISSYVKDNKKIIEIFNDGPNIPNEIIEKIFNNLYKSKKGNFGLGLAISKKTIQHYKGEIKAENTENGVIFKIIL